MSKRWLIGGSLLLTSAAFGQTEPGIVWVTHVANRDGSISVVAENHGFAPVTVYLSAELVNMRSSLELPAKVVVFPAKTPQALTTFTTLAPYAYSYRYHAPSYLGIYTSKIPDTTRPYQLPFKPGTKWAWGLFDPKTGLLRFSHNSYVFAVAASTPVRAAREGIVAYIKQSEFKNKGPEPNMVVVFHDDGTYAYYANLTRNSVTVALGQRVGQGELLAYSSSEKKHPPLWFMVQHLAEQGPENLPIVFDLSAGKP